MSPTRMRRPRDRVLPLLPVGGEGRGQEGSHGEGRIPHLTPTLPAPRGRRGGRTIEFRARSAPLLGLMLTLLAAPAQAQPADGNAASNLFGEIATVLRHPRCLNCHVSGDAPRQGDDRHIHLQNVVRGPDGRGFVTLRCNACHQDTNTAGGAVPGAPHWGLPPRSMAWEGLPDAALCRALVDPKKNGGRTLAQLVVHMSTDPLVQYAWNAGGRTPPPIAQDPFHDLFRRWVAAGAPCPTGG